MANKIQIKRSKTAGKKPTTLAEGELALNLPDEKLFTSDGAKIIELGKIDYASDAEIMAGTESAHVIAPDELRKASTNGTDVSSVFTEFPLVANGPVRSGGGTIYIDAPANKVAAKNETAIISFGKDNVELTVNTGDTISNVYTKLVNALKTVPDPYPGIKTLKDISKLDNTGTGIYATVGSPLFNTVGKTMTEVIEEVGSAIKIIYEGITTRVNGLTLEITLDSGDNWVAGFGDFNPRSNKWDITGTTGQGSKTLVITFDNYGVAAGDVVGDINDHISCSTLGVTQPGLIIRAVGFLSMNTPIISKKPDPKDFADHLVRLPSSGFITRKLLPNSPETLEDFKKGDPDFIIDGRAAKDFFALREINFYINPTGNDSNDGLSAATPFQHIDKAFEEGANHSKINIYLSKGTHGFTPPSGTNQLQIKCLHHICFSRPDTTEQSTKMIGFIDFDAGTMTLDPSAYPLKSTQLKYSPATNKTDFFKPNSDDIANFAELKKEFSSYIDMTSVTGDYLNLSPNVINIEYVLVINPKFHIGDVGNTSTFLSNCAFVNTNSAGSSLLSFNNTDLTMNGHCIFSNFHNFFIKNGNATIGQLTLFNSSFDAENSKINIIKLNYFGKEIDLINTNVVIKSSFFMDNAGPIKMIGSSFHINETCYIKSHLAKIDMPKMLNMYGSDFFVHKNGEQLEWGNAVDSFSKPIVAHVSIDSAFDATVPFHTVAGSNRFAEYED